MELFSKLGIDARLLAAQLLNFSVLVVLLWRFLYRPIIRILNERRRQVEANEQRAKDLEGKFAAAETAYAARVAAGERRAEALVSETEASLRHERETATTSARREAERIISEARERAAREHNEALETIREESVELVRSGIRKVLAVVADERLTELYLKKAEHELKHFTS